MSAQPYGANQITPVKFARYRSADVRKERHHVRCSGKGRKERCTPLTAQTDSILSVWLRDLGHEPAGPLFPTSRGRRLSNDAVALLVAKHAATAEQSCPTLKNKTVTPHVLRHTCAMTLLRERVDIAVIALWLGHESVETTQMYVHADLTIKERALARTTPPKTTSGRYRPPDRLVAFLLSGEPLIMPSFSSRSPPGMRLSGPSSA